MATISYPGVYLSESFSQNFSISNTVTAVPVFAYDSNDGVHSGNIIQSFTSWKDFTAAQLPEHTNLNYYNSVRLWFMNGGGKCYLVDKGHIYEAVSRYEDITLIVANGFATNILEQFNRLISNGYPVFGLFDGSETSINADDTADDVMKDLPATGYAAAFYPWVNVDWTTSAVPPSTVAAIAIAKGDRSRGVWKAPANIVIDGIVPKFLVTDTSQGVFTQGKALNMIRTFPDIGTVIWGARTLEDSDNWRYIPVRRLFSMVERDIQKALNKLLFEPNSQPTWQRVKVAIDNYLYRLWQQGALMGNKEDQAWFVQIGKDITMTEDDISQGKMIVKIGLAASRPAEFILLQFTQNIAQ